MKALKYALLAVVVMLPMSFALDPRCERRPDHPECQVETTTTTTVETTTTTAPPTPSSTLQPPSGDDFHFMFSADAADGTRYRLAELPYDRFLIPGHMWTDGDRSGYRCAYSFAVHNDGHPYMAVLATRPSEADSYVVINDRAMDEGVRYFDGTLADAGREIGDCSPPQDAYEPYEGPHTEVRVEIWHNRGPGALPYPVEAREYLGDLDDNRPEWFTAFSAGLAKLEFKEHITEPFEVTSPLGRTHTVYEQVTLIFHFNADGTGFKPAVAYYLQLLNPEYDMVVFTDT